ncbi:MAG: hypothetical protein LBJ40_14370 [Delftia acidovorans]|jgi:hypothetical protein|nr:hypothetical protein [Delftia acidovorans]
MESIEWSEMHDLRKTRGMLIWGIPFCIGLLLMGLWVLDVGLISTIEEISLRSAMVRITPGAPLSIYIIIISIIMAVGAVLKAIPCSDSVAKNIDRIFCMSNIFGACLIAVCVFVLTPLQYYAMPKMGYVRCSILEDHPNMYFTDWVKKPEWCVRGKSREWVREQARLADKKGT